jgi:N-acetylmuramic acid 6-phosphate etherase
VAGARAEGVTDLWTWGYEACGHMSSLATPDAPRVWAATTRALTAQEPVEQRPARALVREMNRLDATIPAAVAAAGDELAAAIDAIVEKVAAGGRLVYVGAGTSIRLADIDAVECPPTFGTDPNVVIAVGAGECAAVEDDAEQGVADTVAAGVGPADAVVAISASGSTPYTVAALRTACDAGALCVAVVCARDSELARLADHAIVADVGAEIVSGSTRLKAGTAQKLIVNAISTVTMIRLGRTYNGLMVGVVPDNAKLRERARRNVVLASGADEAAVDAAFAAAGGDARVALVTLLAGVDPAIARTRLAAAHGSVRDALA